MKRAVGTKYTQRYFAAKFYKKCSVKKDIANLGGSSLLDKFSGSLPLLLSNVYPDYNWLPWKFTIPPRNYWDDTKNQKKFLEWAAKELKIKDMSDWYNVTYKVTLPLNICFNGKDFHDIGGSNLLRSKYETSLLKLLSTMYPDYNWLPWKFEKSNQNILDTVKNPRKFMDWAATQLNINEMSDWYKIKVMLPLNINLNYKDLSEIGGNSLLANYQGSMYLLLSEVYPDYDWLPWKFVVPPRNFDRKKFMKWAAKELKIEQMSDWYKVSIKVFFT
jgi:hypothetical protein